MPEEKNKTQDVLAKLKDVRVEQKYNNFVSKNDGAELNRVCTEMGLSEDFVKSYTYNSGDKRELIGLILTQVKGDQVVKGVTTEASKILGEAEEPKEE